jgi:hypothetical protein
VFGVSFLNSALLGLGKGLISITFFESRSGFSHNYLPYRWKDEDEAGKPIEGVIQIRDDEGIDWHRPSFLGWRRALFAQAFSGE